MGIGRSAILPYAKLPALGKGIVSPSGSRGWTPYWNPLKLTNIVEWWRADSTVSSSSLVSQLTGKKNGVHAINSVDAKKPELVFNYANGKPAIKFKITAAWNQPHYLDFGDIALTDFSIHIVYKIIENLYSDYHEVLTGNTAGVLKGEVYTGGVAVGATGLGVKDNVGNKERLSKIEKKILHVATIQNDKIYVDGEEVTDYQTADALAGIILSRIGTRTDAEVNNNFWNGFFLDCVLATEKHSEADILEYHNYARNRYGIKTPTAVLTVDTKHIEYTAGVYQFGFNDTQVFFSSDSGVNWNTKNFSGAGEIESAYIFDNGSLFFTKLNHLYGSTDGLENITEIIPKDLNGDDYIHHVPANALYPGYYYRAWEYIKKSYVGGSELAVWGNFSHNAGAAPVNVFSCDDSLNVKVIYQFGQNPLYTDDGTITGGAGGTLLGDATNAVYTFHVHSTAYDSVNDYFYVATGDPTMPTIIMKGRLSGGVWTWDIIYNQTVTGIFRWWLIGLNIINGVAYWGTEGGSRHGIVRCKVEDFMDISGHEMLVDPLDIPNDPDSEVYDLFIDTVDGIGILATEHRIFITQNGFKNYVEVIDSGLTGKNWLTKIHKIGTRRYQFEKVADKFWNNSMYLDITPSIDKTFAESFVNGVPSNLSAVAISTTEIDLTCDSLSTNEDGFAWMISTDDVTYTELARTGAGVKSYSATGLTESTLYYFKVRAFRNPGSVYSAYSNTDSDTTKTSVTAPDHYWKFDEASGNLLDSKGGVNGTLGAGATAPTQGTAGIIDKAYSFDGSNDTILLGSQVNAGNTFSLSIWIKPNTQTDEYGCVFTHAATVGLYMAGSTRKMNLYVTADKFSANALTNGVWNHVGLIISAGTGKHYLNGQANGNLASIAGVIFSQFGWDAASEAFKGSLCECAFWHSAITEDEMVALYNGGAGLEL